MVMVSATHKLAFFPVPKVACTTLKRVIYRVENGHAFRMDKHDGKTIQLCYPTADFAQHQLDALQDHWKFAVVRDPAKRIISAYTNKIRAWSVRFSKALEQGNRRDALRADGIEAEPTLDAFLLNLAAYRRHFAPVRHHTDAHTVFLGNDLSAFDKVFRIEEMEDLRAELSRRLGHDVKFPKANPSTSRAEPQTQAARDALMEFVAPDYAFLSRFYPRPVSANPAPTNPARSQADAVPLSH